MTCCQNKRSSLSQSLGNPPPAMIAGGMRGLSTGEPVQFQYVGLTALRVRGGFSGRIYKFDSTGAVTAVDVRDAPGIAAVPNLRRVRGAV